MSDTPDTLTVYAGAYEGNKADDIVSLLNAFARSVTNDRVLFSTPEAADAFMASGGMPGDRVIYKVTVERMP